MGIDVVTEMTRMWSELREELDSLDARSPEAKVEKLLDHVVVLLGVEFRTLYPGLEEADDEADVVTTKALRRSDRIQSAVEKLSLPPTEGAWRAFADALGDHLDKSPKDVGARLEALSEEDRTELGERTKIVREGLS